LTCAGACKLARTPQLTYEDARLKLRQGQLQSALEETERACRRYSSEQSEWHWRFKVLKAEILARQGLFNESLELLRAEPPASLGTDDLAVRRSLVEGAASAFLRRPKDAAEFLARAETLARANHPDLLAEVALAQGASDFLAGDPQGAATAYRDSLQRAQEQKDLYVEANALAGLGVVATKEEHYGEFIEWSQAELQLAESVGAQKSLVMILGNMAWGYLRLGDL